MRLSARVAAAATAFLCALATTTGPADADATPVAAAIATTAMVASAPTQVPGSFASGTQAAAPASAATFKSLFVSLAARNPPAPALVAAPVKSIPVLGPLAPKVQSLPDAGTAQVKRDPGSLAQLVSDTLASDPANDEHECLAASVYFEAKGQPYKGQLAVAETVLNRSKSGRFPATVCGVVKQRGQFSFVRHGQLPSVRRAAKQWQEAVAISSIALKQAVAEVAHDALYFNAGRMPSPGLIRVAQIGAHIFYR